jgi:predicted DNA-binding transcriptional regulator AlpA
MTRTAEAPTLLLTARAAAAQLSICQKTLYSVTVPRGTLPCVRIGRRVLYDQRDVLAWIDRQKGGAQ